MSDQPLVHPDQPVRLSGSAWTGLDACPLKWFLSRHARADRGTSDSAAFGSVVHAVADALVRGELPAEEETLLEPARAIWPHLGFEAGWQAEAEWGQFRVAVARLVAWHKGRAERRCVGSELGFETTVHSDTGDVALSGHVDRLEIGPDGLHLVDFKTQRTPVGAKDLPRHRQLQTYQLAAAIGAFDSLLSEGDRGIGVAGAELVLLRVPERDGPMPKIQRQEPIDVDAVVTDLEEAAEQVRQEIFPPNPSGGACRYCSFLTLCPDKSGQEV